LYTTYGAFALSVVRFYYRAIPGLDKTEILVLAGFLQDSRQGSRKVAISGAKPAGHDGLRWFQRYAVAIGRVTVKVVPLPSVL
jgi:hypothetical protein